MLSFFAKNLGPDSSSLERVLVQTDAFSALGFSRPGLGVSAHRTRSRASEQLCCFAKGRMELDPLRSMSKSSLNLPRWVVQAQ